MYYKCEMEGGTNQLVESCKMCLSSELFITELECLAYFNHFATFPFLNCAEMSTHADLPFTLPKLHKDMKTKRKGIWSKFTVSVHGMSTPTLSSDLSKRIVDKMCISAATEVKIQYRREYGFSDAEKRATDLSTLAANDLEVLPTNNLVTKRDLSRYDREAQVAKSRNRWFKVTNIQNNMVLCKKKVKSKLIRFPKRYLKSSISTRRDGTKANKRSLSKDWRRN